MKISNNKPIGLTKDAGFQIGVRKTFSVPTQDAWDFLFSPPGLLIWLGANELNTLEFGQEFTTANNITINVTTLKEGSHFRMQWKPLEWEVTTMLQLRVIPTKEKTTISFHQDKLSSSEQRELMQQHWKKVLDQFSVFLNV